MAAYQLAQLLLVMFVVQHYDCQSVITIMPASLSLAPNTSDDGGMVTVRCQPPPMDSGDQLLVINIGRQLENEDTSTVIAASSATQNPNAVMKVTIPGATVSGGTTDGFITVNLTQAKCGDTGIYTCSSTVLLTSGGTEAEASTKNLTVDVRPGQITLTPDPSGKTNWVVNETVRLLCNAPVGTVEQNTEVVWLWGYRDNSGGFGSSWQVYEVDADIDRDVDRTPLTCYERRSSRLTRRLTLEDNRREYRCYISRGGLPYQQYAATFSVGTVTASSGNGNNGGGGGTGSNTSKADVGMIVGIVIAVLVAIVVAIVIIVVVMRRRRNSGGAADDRDKPADVSAPPYAAEPPVTYSQPNRFRDRGERGVTNKAMDDMGEKPSPYESKPARYANDFHQGRGRPNQGYDNDNEPRPPRYSTDDGGSQVNTSMHSMGDGDPTLGTAI